ASLRTASSYWRDLDAPYEGARVRVLAGLACKALGDHEAAVIELAAARHVFDAPRAALGLANPPPIPLPPAVTSATPLPAVPSRPSHVAGLTSREVEVLQLIATGKTNRAIADALDISEKTVARHVSNIFIKLDVSSRAAATAFAYEHHLISPST